jgi:Holliday junction DNA helicase RuvA
MIARLTGKIEPVGIDVVIVDVRGVGYEVWVPAGTAGRLRPNDSGDVSLNVYTAVREDAIQLFGFADATERSVFEGLISVSGVGPKTGLNVLSTLTVPEIVQGVADDDIAQFTRVTGIGKKTAQRLLLELKNKFNDLSGTLQPHVKAADKPNEIVAADLRSALLNLGYKSSTVDKVIDKLELAPDDERAFEELLRETLKHAAKL